jgi:type III secretory pathway component EscV
VKETLAILVRDPKFWTAILMVIQTLLFLFYPGFPVELWTALSALLAVVFAAFSTKSAVTEKRARKLNAEGRAQKAE